MVIYAQYTSVLLLLLFAYKFINDCYSLLPRNKLLRKYTFFISFSLSLHLFFEKDFFCFFFDTHTIDLLNTHNFIDEFRIIFCISATLNNQIFFFHVKNVTTKQRKNDEPKVKKLENIKLIIKIFRITGKLFGRGERGEGGGADRKRERERKRFYGK